MSEKPISTRIAADIVETIDQLAAAHHTSRTGMIVLAIQQMVNSRQKDEALLASLDGMATKITANEAKHTQQLAQGLGELNDRLRLIEARIDDLEEFQAHHLFNFLAYTAPDADETTAAKRGGTRFMQAMRNIQAVKSGELPGLRDQAKAVAEAEISGEFAKP